MSMNVFLAKKGNKVRFMNRGGYDGDLKWAASKLKPGEVYIIDRVEIYQSSTNVYLEGFGDHGFNSVHFEDVGLADYAKIESLTNEEFANFVKERLESVLTFKELEQFFITVDDADCEDDENEHTVIVDAKVTGALWTFWFSKDSGQYNYDVLGDLVVKRHQDIIQGKQPEPLGIYVYD